MTRANFIKKNIDRENDLKVPERSSSYDLCEPIMNEITQMRRINNISQRELAARSGVKQQMIARLESGINTPNMSTVLKLLAAFGKTLYIGDKQGGSGVTFDIRGWFSEKTENGSVTDDGPATTGKLR